MTGEGTEKPTPKRLKDAEKKGDVTKSPAVSAVAGALVFMLSAGSILGDLPSKFGAAIGTGLKHGPGNAASVDLAGLFLPEILLLPVLVMAGAALAGIAQTGFSLSTARLAKLDFFKPGRLMSLQNFTAAAIALLACSLSASAGVWLTCGIAASSFNLSTPGPGSLHRLLNAFGGASWKVAAAGAVYALFDVLMKRRQRLKRLMMTRREITEEMKESEGDPLIKSRRRRLHRQLAMAGLRDGVRTAKAVLVNPTRIAVAIRYDEGDDAPVVAFKGEGEAARIMREEAENSGVPIVRNVPLARSIYRSLEVDDEIPPELYEAVAGVLHAAARALSDGVHMVEAE